MAQGFKLILVFLLAFSFVSADFGAGLTAADKVQTKCPVMGWDIDKSRFVDYKGNRIYFCCASCPEDFKKDPEKYVKKLKDSGIVLEKTPGK
jgi:YHS domain-containing protein